MKCFAQIINKYVNGTFSVFQSFSDIIYGMVECMAGTVPFSKTKMFI